MRMRGFLAATAAALALAAGLGQAGARPLTPAEKRFSPYTGVLPACADLGVLARISDRFEEKERKFWNSKLEIVDYDRIRQTGVRTWGMDHIPRRYCEGRVLLNDRRWRHVTYWIGEDLGMIGRGFGVEWCVSGLDRNWAFAPNCKMARP